MKLYSSKTQSSRNAAPITSVSPADGQADVPGATALWTAHEVVTVLVDAALPTWTDTDVSATTRASTASELCPVPVDANNAARPLKEALLNHNWHRRRGRCRFGCIESHGAHDAFGHRELDTARAATLAARCSTTVATTSAVCPTREVVTEGILATRATCSNADISATRSAWITPELLALPVEATLRRL